MAATFSPLIHSRIRSSIEPDSIDDLLQAFHKRNDRSSNRSISHRQIDIVQCIIGYPPASLRRSLPMESTRDPARNTSISPEEKDSTDDQSRVAFREFNPPISDYIPETISRLYVTLSPSHRRVADQLLANPISAIAWSISELSIQARVSDATVSRFCTAIGLSGYPELRKALIRAVSRQGSASGDASVGQSSSPSRDAHNSIHFIQQGMLQSILQARTLVLTGFGPSAFICEFVAAHFSGKLRNLVTLGLAGESHAERHIGNFGDDDLLILFENEDNASYDDRFSSIARTKRLPVLPSRKIHDAIHDGSHFFTPITKGKMRSVSATLTAALTVHHLLELAVMTRKQANPLC
ncbi:MurR/RpiR family transcriptional regulator [Burkholderia cenocepacia]|uniref:MurR/RpiR family transcriptional regulator n=1 Tax=Burkholderia cenocepacia TaxID=95486 RepID=UPI001C6272BA|nr:hypothetical protein [Burkholderia cenocepacia]